MSMRVFTKPHELCLSEQESERCTGIAGLPDALSEDRRGRVDFCRLAGDSRSSVRFSRRASMRGRS